MDADDRDEGPSETVRAEIVSFLLADQTRLGATYRAEQDGLTDDQIMELFGIQTTGLLWKMRRMFKVLFDANIPTAPAVVLSSERKIRAMLANWPWSGEAQSYFAELQDALAVQASNPEARVREDVAAGRQTAAVEAQGRPGIYVYTLPHYYRYPYDPESGRTLLKVGHSGAKMIARFREQTRTTALPEEPILLRVYPVCDEESSAMIERKFHDLLKGADHNRPFTRSAGQEWFLTSERLLDAIAQVLGLPIHIVNVPEVDGND